ncbi:MAG: exonuclease SbcCD subunit D, partial [Desulfosudaceae bacterium]
MSTITFIHAADLHLDTPFKGLTGVDPDLAETLKKATFQAFDNIVSACLEEAVDFLLIAGDIFDSETRSLGAQLKFFEGLRRLARAEIPVFFVGGNHDPAGSWLRELELPGQVHQFPAAGPGMVPFCKDGRRLADIHGISFAERSVGDNLAAGFSRPDDAAPLSIALLHGTIGPAGPHEQYSPFTEADIRDKGFDYWALGHMHRQQVIRPADPAIVYPGNPQGRDFGECGRRGCYHVTLVPGRPPELRFIPTGAVVFETMTVDISGVTALEHLRERVEEACEQAAISAGEAVRIMLRVRLEGRTSLHADLQPLALEELREQINGSD